MVGLCLAKKKKSFRSNHDNYEGNIIITIISLSGGNKKIELVNNMIYYEEGVVRVANLFY